MSSLLSALTDIGCKSDVIFNNRLEMVFRQCLVTGFGLLLAIAVGAPRVVGWQPLWKQYCHFFRVDVNATLVEKVQCSNPGQNGGLRGLLSCHSECSFVSAPPDLQQHMQ